VPVERGRGSSDSDAELARDTPSPPVSEDALAGEAGPEEREVRACLVERDERPLSPDDAEDSGVDLR